MNRAALRRLRRRVGQWKMPTDQAPSRHQLMLDAALEVAAKAGAPEAEAETAVALFERRRREAARRDRARDKAKRDARRRNR